MTSLDVSIAAVRSALNEGWRFINDLPTTRALVWAAGHVQTGWRRLARWLNSVMPKGLYARVLLIIILPMVILQSVIAFVFMERHWNLVTQRLSAGVVQDIAALIDVYKGYPQDKDRAKIKKIAQDRLGLVVDFLPLGDLPPPGPKPFFSLLDQALSEEIRKQVGAGRNPHPARSYRDAGVRAAQRGLRLQFGDLPDLDGRHVIDLDCGGHHLPAQSDQADPAAGRRRRKLRQGAGSAQLPPAWRARGAAGGGRLHRDEDAHRARHRAAHGDARRRQPRSAHGADPLQA
jgi:hypothetical protein